MATSRLAASAALVLSLAACAASPEEDIATYLYRSCRYAATDSCGTSGALTCLAGNATLSAARPDYPTCATPCRTSAECPYGAHGATAVPTCSTVLTGAATGACFLRCSDDGRSSCPTWTSCLQERNANGTWWHHCG